MTQANLTTIKIEGITQVGIVVKDVEQVAQNYWNILGIGPWTIMTVPPPYMHDRTYGGKPVYYVGKFGFAKLGDFELELLESIEGPNVYKDFLAAHGEGCNHLQYFVDSISELEMHTEAMVKNGIGVLQTARFGENGGLAYFDAVETLKTVWEPIKWADNFSVPTTSFPEDPEEVSPARIKVREMKRVSFVVKDLEETMESYSGILGIGPWKMTEATSPTLGEWTYYGKPARHSFRMGSALSGAIEIELVQPVSGDTVYADFLRERGEGISHFVFEVKDLSETSAVMENEGFAAIQSGVCGEDAYVCYDTRGPLKIIWQATQPSRA